MEILDVFLGIRLTNTVDSQEKNKTYKEIVSINFILNRILRNQSNFHGPRADRVF